MKKVDVNNDNNFLDWLGINAAPFVEYSIKVVNCSLFSCYRDENELKRIIEKVEGFRICVKREQKVPIK